MICAWSKILLFIATSGLMGFIVYRCLFGIQFSFSETISIYAERKEEKRKFVAMLTKDNEIKIVYVDNDHMEDIEDIRHQNAVTNTSGDVTSSPALQSYYESSSAGTENPYSIEWDETIDYDHYGKIPFNETKRSLDLSDKPKVTIVLVQEHYHRNSPMTNIMYRYGDQNQLTFALPKKSGFQKYWPLRFHPSFVDTSLTFSDQINMLINPTYRYETLRRFMPMDTVFITVLHDPVKSFISRLVKHRLLRKYKLEKRLKIIKNLVRRKKVFGDKYTNTMAFQFGYSKKHEQLNRTTMEIIEELKAQFNIVLIGDYLDESLVVLKRILNWSLADLVHISRENMNFGGVQTELRDAIVEHNKLDQKIYDYFNRTFWQTVKSFGLGFFSDLEELNRLNRKFKNYCGTPFRITSSRERDTVCTKMNWGDKEYVIHLKQKYQAMSNSELNSGLQYLKNSLEIYFNTTVNEIQRYLES